MAENLAGFLGAVFTKRYTNPSTDVIEVLGGLDAIDKLVSDLVNGLEAIVRQSAKPDFRSKAVAATTSMVAGAYQTSLVSYFMHRDLFPALTKVSEVLLRIFILIIGSTSMTLQTQASSHSSCSDYLPTTTSSRPRTCIRTGWKTS